MLPVAIRSHLSIAFGTVDEEFCKWAKIILTYSSIKPQLSDDSSYAFSPSENE
jgi:hypothetical protein